jgi:hypothetical protein
LKYGKLPGHPDIMKGGDSHSLRQGGPPRRQTKDGKAQLDAQVHRRETSLNYSWHPASEATSLHVPLDEEFIKR